MGADLFSLCLLVPRGVCVTLEAPSTEWDIRLTLSTCSCMNEVADLLAGERGHPEMRVSTEAGPVRLDSFPRCSVEGELSP